jgi:hypothetical protein
MESSRKPNPNRKKMTASQVLSTAPLEYPAMDYAWLRQEGIRLLERLSGQLWTDFNTHDPGITILEQLCYAITDLGYRINYDLKDLLTSGPAAPYPSLYSPAQVLTTDPVTRSDLRKWIIDVNGVKNAWVEPIETTDTGLLYDPSEVNLYLKTSAIQPPHREPVLLRGLYRILIEIDESLGLHSPEILPEVNRRLHFCRSLCQDFDPPAVLKPLGITVDARIEISAVEDPERLLAEIVHRLANFISPRIRFHTLAEMLDQGKSITEIFDGPALQHGFIDNVELEQFQRKAGLRTSDLLQEIMNVAGVVTVSQISVSDGDKSDGWYLKLNPDSAPFLDIDKSLFNPAGPTLRLARAGIQVRIQAARVKEIVDDLQKSAVTQPLPESERDIHLPAGKDRGVAAYTSIQHQFPAAYGIGAIGLSESASPLRKAQARQLKAYLLFFDQLLANYFAQLGNARELFSFYNQQPGTYFSQIIADASLGLDEIRVSDLAAHAANVQSMTAGIPANGSPVSVQDAQRKNRFLNHLLARFAEQFTDYALLQYANLGEGDLIRTKCAFLQDYRAIGAARGTGFNYTLPSWDSENTSGLEKRIARKLGISSYRTQDLAGMDDKAEGGFHTLEHILLRPRLADLQQWAQTVSGISWQTAFVAQPESRDPYSLRLSFIFPDWVEHLKEPGFHDLIEKTLREETPAHIHLQIHWLAQPDMLAFESALKDWLETAIAGRLWDPANLQPGDLTQLKLRDARDRMVQVLGIGFPYPLRDVKLTFPSIVTFGYPAVIEILGGQANVLYQLCDEDGNAYSENGTGFEVLAKAGQPILLQTPAIQKDITFTILAIRDVPDQNIHLETYLNQVVSIKAGIDTKLPVVFQPAAGQTVGQNLVFINYADPVSVTISGSQEGVSYKLVTGPKENQETLSDPKKGTTSDITLRSNRGFMEDTAIHILAYRTTNWHISALLDTGLSILVRPDPALTVNLSDSIVNYRAASRLTITAPQASAVYRIYKRDLLPAEYLTAPTPDNLAVKTDEGRQVLVKAPGKVMDWNNPDGFVLLDDFKDLNGALSASTGSLLEDMLLIVQAEKIVNHARLQLNQVYVVLVRPDPAPTVSADQLQVPAGEAGLVLVNNTQKGVGYQLRLDTDNTPVNPPGYHLGDRGIETIRLEVDFIVEDQGNPVLLLPAGAITNTTTFNVLAIKTLTGVSAQLNDKVTLDTSAP